MFSCGIIFDRIEGIVTGFVFGTMRGSWVGWFF